MVSTKGSLIKNIAILKGFGASGQKCFSVQSTESYKQSSTANSLTGLETPADNMASATIRLPESMKRFVRGCFEGQRKQDWIAVASVIWFCV